ncbi:MAG: zinc-binding dehydrogenase [Candidatus Geothermarchaeales archaeon]
MVRASVMRGPNLPLEVRDFPEPKMEEGSVLLRTIASEVCGTDVHIFHGRLADVPYPIIPGHISVGRVERIAGKASYVEGGDVAEGDVVAFLDVHETCGRCWYCLVAKASTRCPHRKVYGVTYSSEKPPHLLGGWSEKIYLKPGVKTLKLPEDLSPLEYISAGCALPTSVHGIERAQIALGDTVVIQGSGPVGLCSAILAQLSGAVKVIVVGAPEMRLRMAERIGADHTVNIEGYDSEARVRKVLELTDGRGADVTVEATGSPLAVREGMEITRDAGRYVVVGQYTDAGSVEINPHLHINKKHLEIRGSWGIDFSHLYRAVQILAKNRGRFPWIDFITKQYGLEESNEALSDVENLEVVKAVIRP